MPAYFDELTRLSILAEHATSGFADDKALDGLTRFTADLCEAPVCMVSLVAADRQHFVSRTGLELSEAPREMSICQVAMHHPEILVVPDARADARFADNALVKGEPPVRFYAGAPLRSKEGAPLGALCVIAHEPRAGLTPLQADGLRIMADQVMTILDKRRSALLRSRSETEVEQTLVERESRFRALADTLPQIVWSARPDGFHDYYNARWYEFTGMPHGSTDGEGWNGMFHPDDQEAAWAKWRHSLETGEPYEIEYRLRNAAGEYRWTLGRALPIRDPNGNITRWFGTCTEIHEQKLLLEQRQIISQELSHRIKNIFSIVAGMISLSARRHPEAKVIASDLRERVVALGRAHDFVRPHSPASMPTAPSSLHGMLRKIFEPYDDVRDGPRIVVVGDDPRIDDRSTTPLALVFHELATNAAKYGALSGEKGRVELSIRREDEHLTFHWREVGGPPIVAAPDKTGFGTQLVEMSAVRQLGAELHRNWDPAGLDLSFAVPLTAISRELDDR